MPGPDDFRGSGPANDHRAHHALRRGGERVLGLGESTARSGGIGVGTASWVALQPPRHWLGPRARGHRDHQGHRWLRGASGVSRARRAACGVRRTTSGDGRYRSRCDQHNHDAAHSMTRGTRHTPDAQHAQFYRLHANLTRPVTPRFPVQPRRFRAPPTSAITTWRQASEPFP